MTTVGSSIERTPTKLAMLRSLALTEFNITRARRNVPYRGHVLIDLTAGNAAGAAGLPWWRASSPAIFAYLAATHDRVRVRLYEIDRGTFEALTENLHKHLPGMGFMLRRGGWNWINTRTGSEVWAHHADSRAVEDFGDVRRYEHVLISNDPNSMHGWALNMRHLSGARGTAVFVASMGCNSHALKRAVPLENRGEWFRHIDDAVTFVRSRDRYDLRLLRIPHDVNQWAYLVLAPTSRPIPRPDGMMVTSWRAAPRQFESEISCLFYNNQERHDGHRWQADPVAGVQGAGGSASDLIPGG